MKPGTSWSSLSTLIILGAANIAALQVDITSATSIKSTASQIAFDMMSIYTGNRTGDVPGNLPAPFFWWECGAMFGAMVDYWYYTGDETYNEVTTQALLHQVGPMNNYMPPNQTSTLGNDDQSFWGIAAMSAAEYNFPNPPADQPQWLPLAQAVFNSQIPRWDNKTCNGGLRWQIPPFNPGFDYKNTISNGLFFNFGARLARFTNNQSYADWAETTWNWMESVEFIDADFNVFDGAGIPNCDKRVPLQWSYNIGVLLHGAANMYNYTNGSEIWRQRTAGLLNATQLFFSNPDAPDIMVEVACENTGTCNNDQKSFKAYLARWLAPTALLAPFTASYIQPKLAASALAAAKQCSGGETGTKCGMKWVNGAQWDGSQGPGQQMAALEVVLANMQFVPQRTQKLSGPLTADTGGTSISDPTAGTIPLNWKGQVAQGPPTTGDKVGAAFVTLLMTAIIGSCVAWMFTT